MPDVVLIGGCPRSGTTLLAELLNVSPEAGIIFEYPLGTLVRDLQPIFAYERTVASERRARTRAADAAGSDPTVYVNVKQFIERPTFPSLEKLSEIVCGIVSASLGKSDLRVIGSKTPGSDARDLRAPLEPHFPVIQHIFLIRNPAHTINSMMNRRNRARLGHDGWHLADVEAAIDEYRAAVRLMLSASSLHPQYTWIVKYEDIHERSDWFASWLAVTLGITRIDPQSDAARDILALPVATRDVCTADERVRISAEFGAAIAAWPQKRLTGAAIAIGDALHDCVDRLRPNEIHVFAASARPKFLGLGWGQVEPGGVWSDGEHAHLFWSHAPGGRFELRFEVDYFLPAADSERAIRIDLDGATIYHGLATLSHAERSIIMGPLELSAGVVHRCVVHVEDPQSPAALGLSADTRRLGVLLRSLSLSEVRT